MKLRHPRTFLLFLIILLVRSVPLLLIALNGRAGSFNLHHLDPQIYLWGADAIATRGQNPFPFFPPLNFLFIALFLLAGNNAPIVPLAANAILGYLTVIVLYLLAKRLFNEQTAVVTALVSGLYPNFILYSLTFYSETLALFFVVSSFFFLAGHLQTSRLFDALAGGIFWGLASQTRGGLVYFSLFVALTLMAYRAHRRPAEAARAAAGFLMACLGTFIAVGMAAQPVHDGLAVNSRNGVVAVVLGANRITVASTDYGNIRGNLYYDITQCNDSWPAGSRMRIEDLSELGTIEVLDRVVRFVSADTMLYLKNALLKLSTFWSPNQDSIGYLRTKLRGAAGPAGLISCIFISAYYLLVVAGGIAGMGIAPGPFRIICVLFMVFYSMMIFLTVGNSRLRIPLMPWFMVYCAYFITRFVSEPPPGRRLLLKGAPLLFIGLLLLNSACKYHEILLSPEEIYVRKLELSNQLGFYKTAACLFETHRYPAHLNEHQKGRVERAAETAQERLNGGSPGAGGGG